MKKFLCAAMSAILLMTIITGCGSSGKTSGGYAKQISFFQWTEYTPQSVLDGFKKKYGITVKMTEYSSSEQMLSKLKSGQLSQYDVAVPSTYSIQPMINQNLIEKIDKASIPNLKNIDKSVLNKNFDKGNQYTVPYMIAPCVLVVNTKKVTIPIKSFNDLLDPSLKSKVVVVDDERSITAVALKALGYSINDKTPGHLTEALNWLNRFKPNIKVFDSDSPKTSLISGDCTVGYVWNGEASLAMQANHDLHVVWTKESDKSPIIEMDNLVLIKGTPHKREAELFINYILDGRVSKQITAVYPYTNPNLAAHKLLGSSYLNNSAINIPSVRLAKAEYTDYLGDAVTLYDDVWTKFKS